MASACPDTEACQWLLDQVPDECMEQFGVVMNDCIDIREEFDGRPTGDTDWTAEKVQQYVTGSHPQQLSLALFVHPALRHIIVMDEFHHHFCPDLPPLSDSIMARESYGILIE